MTNSKVIDKCIFLLLAVLTIGFYSCLFIEEVDVNFKIFVCTLPFWLAALSYIVSKEQLVERSIGFYIDLQERLGEASVVLNGLTVIFVMPSMVALFSGSYTAAIVLAAYGILLSVLVNLLIRRF